MTQQTKATHSKIHQSLQDLDTQLSSLSSQDLQEISPELCHLQAHLAGLNALNRTIRSNGEVRQQLPASPIVPLSIENPAQTEGNLDQLVAENQLLRSLLDGIFEADPGGLAVVSGPELRFVYINPAFRFLVTHFRADPIGQPYGLIWPLKQSEVDQERIKTVMETGIPFQDSHYAYTFPDGTQRLFTYQARRIDWAAQPAVLLILWDNTDLAQAQVTLNRLLEEMRRQAEEYHAVFEAMSDPVIVYDKKGKPVRANQAAIRLCGTDPARLNRRELIRKLAIRDMDGRPLRVGELVTTRALKGEKAVGQRYRITNARGQDLTILASSDPIFDSSSQVVGAVAIWHDITAVENTEAQLAEIARFPEENPNPVMRMDLDGTLLYTNSASRTIIEKAAGNEGSRTPTPWLEQIRQAVQGGKRLAIDIEIGDRFYSFLVVPIRGAGYVNVYGREITNRIKTEEILLASQRRFQQLADAMPQLVWTARPDGKVDYYNQRFEEYDGITPETPETWNWSPVVHPVDLQPTLDAWQHAVETGESYQIVHRVRMSDGEYRWHLSRGVPSYGPDGTIAQWFGTATDIHDQKLAEESLRESEERFRLMGEILPFGVWLADPAGHCLYTSQSYLDLLGVTMEEMRSMSVMHRLPPEESGPAQARWNDCIHTGADWDEVHRVLGVDGRHRTILTRGRPVRDDKGKIAGWAGIHLDVTESEQMSSQLSQDAAQIEVQQRLIEQREQERLVIARDLHDGPVQDLTGAHYALEGLIESADEILAPALRAVRDTVKSVVGDLRGYAGELRPPTLAKFGVGKAIRSHLETFKEKHPELRVSFEEKQEGNLIPETMRLAMYRIYQEATTNIARHAEASQVKVVLQKTENQVQLEIQDNGKGFSIPDDWLALARQGHLGLVGMRERAEAIGGQVTIVSQKGKGTRVTLKIPLDGNPG